MHLVDIDWTARPFILREVVNDHDSLRRGTAMLRLTSCHMDSLNHYLHSDIAIAIPSKPGTNIDTEEEQTSREMVW